MRSLLPDTETATIEIVQDILRKAFEYVPRIYMVDLRITATKSDFDFARNAAVAPRVARLLNAQQIRAEAKLSTSHVTAKRPVPRFPNAPIRTSRHHEPLKLHSTSSTATPTTTLAVAMSANMFSRRALQLTQRRRKYSLDLRKEEAEPKP